LTSHNSETTDSVPYNAHIGIEAERGVSATEGACNKEMFSVADVSGFVWNRSFGSVISQTTFYRKLLTTCTVIKVTPLHICISDLVSVCDSDWICCM